MQNKISSIEIYTYNIYKKGTILDYNNIYIYR